MDVREIEKIVVELKDLHLIELNRKVIPNSDIYCNFSSGGAISFDPFAAEFMSEGEIIWLLLHEEAHLIFPQQRQALIFRRFLLKSLIYLILIGLFAVLIAFW